MTSIYELYRSDYPESCTRFGYFTSKEAASAALKFIADEILRRHPGVKIGSEDDSKFSIDYFAEVVILIAPTRTETIGIIERLANMSHEYMLHKIDEDDWRFEG